MVNFNFKRRNYKPASRKLIEDKHSDGDTRLIHQPIRMVSCDTPEKAGYAGKPSKSQPKLDICKQRLESDFFDIPENLKNYLLERLNVEDAAAKHIEAGDKATAYFNQILEERLTREDGKKRNVAIIPAGEVIDSFGRLLAYISPFYNNTQSDPLPTKGSKERETFNLNMIESGWAAFFPLYPALPQNDDLNLTIQKASEAYQYKKGIWADYGEYVLLGYEFRLCIKLANAKNGKKGIEEAFQRICVDLRDLSVKGKFGFWEVPPPYRLWIWEKDFEQAKTDLNLT